MSKVPGLRLAIALSVGTGMIYLICCRLIAYAILVTVYEKDLRGAKSYVASGSGKCVDIVTSAPGIWSHNMPAAAWWWGIPITAATVASFTITALLITLCFRRPRARFRSMLMDLLVEIIDKLGERSAWLRGSEVHGVISYDGFTGRQLVQLCRKGDSCTEHLLSGHGIAS